MTLAPPPANGRRAGEATSPIALDPVAFAARAFRVLLWRGPLGTARRAAELAAPSLALRRLRVFRRLGGKTGLEIGGPSILFRNAGLVPAYGVAARIDNCIFADHTVWEGEVAAGDTFRFHSRRAPGRQYIAEAADLGAIASDSYDFLLSSHVIEHSANPLKALGEWRRVLKPGGLLVLIAPRKELIFDHRRPITPFSHLLEDEARGMGEDDLTHLEEILALHDLDRDPEAGGAEKFRARSLANFENRCLHQHVFDTALARQAVVHAGFEVLSAEAATSRDILVLALKPGGAA
jgi:SAM-dependent methyltransferase